VPGLLTGECVEHDGFSYLSVTVNADPNDARTDEIGGDVVINDKVAKDWGLHLIDMHLAMGNLVELAKAQGEAYVRGASSEPPRPPVLQ
ncbi:MAG: heat shock protein HspQ, partial [Limisphaerales bacterium]